MRATLPATCLVLALTLFAGGCAVADGENQASRTSTHKSKPNKSKAQATKSSESPSKASTPTSSPTPDVWSVSAVDLIKDYDADRFAADDKYQGHALEVTGVAKSVGPKYVDLSGGSADPFATYISAQVYLDDLSNVTPGQVVTVTSSDLSWTFPVGSGGVIILDYARLAQP
jgi:hypothetical protein